MITILSFFLLAPVALLTEGWVFSPAHMAALGIADTAAVMQRALMAGVCFHAYQQVRKRGRAGRQAGLGRAVWPAG